ncbi:cytochrome c [Pigmentiphaga litoralis]|uniref:cytochrome c n=1 Tax=Pigmentiphaga litoralis TaxID=516702 RepID=UPI001E44DAE7|nr:cytochrome c [Pigmentiphaga litoralis]
MANGLPALPTSYDLTPPDPGNTLHGVVLRPPRMDWDGQRYTGMTLRHADDRALRRIPGVFPAVIDRHFAGVVAVSAVLADQGASRLVVEWNAALREGAKASTGGPDASAGDADGIPGPETFSRDYAWPQAQAAEPCWAVAWVHDRGVSVWAPATDVGLLQAEIATLLSLAVEQVTVLPTGQPAHAGAFDAAADAVLLSRAVYRPVRVRSGMAAAAVMPTRLTATLPSASLSSGKLSSETLSSATLSSATLSSAMLQITTLRMTTGAPVVHRPSIARLLASGVAGGVAGGIAGSTVSGSTVSGSTEPGNRRAGSTASGSPSATNSSADRPPHPVVPYDAAPAIDWHPDASLDNLSTGTTPEGLPAAQVFALESFIDEMAATRGVDPVTLRLTQLARDPRGQALVRTVAERAGWQDTSRGAGRGMAYSSVIDHSTVPPSRTWSAWVAEVAVDAASGHVAVTRVVVGHDIEHLAPGPVRTAQAPIERQIDGVTRALLALPAGFDDWAGQATAPEPKPEPDGGSTAVAPRQAAAGTTDITWVAPGGDVATARPLAWTAAAALPAAAAVANAIFDATGVRLRQPPFNSDAARQQLRGETAAPERRMAYAWLGGIAAAAVGLTAAALPWRPAIAPVQPPDLSVYSAEAIERGRLVAAASDCVVCHTAPGGVPNAGGLHLDTPFGQIVTTNITPDVETGIGNWSYAAFERAMRQGIHRDGRHLYPAFPYTSFAKFTEADMTALYAYMMAQPAVRSTPAPTSLAFPYSIRPLMAGWNTLFHDDQPYAPDPTQSLQWNRGAYLVQGAGHCGACHTPRNALGAEQRGKPAFLAGGEAEGWEAPALNRLSHAPIPWNEGDFFQYLSTGFSPRHGSAAGPMGPVIHGLQQLPSADVAAMAHYLANLDGVKETGGTAPTATVDTALPATQLARIEAATAPRAKVFDAAGERIFEGACAVCHEPQAGPALAGIKLSLALNTNLHSDQPDNVLQSILKGIDSPANDALGDMPAFGSTLNDRQIVDVVRYLRDRFAPDRPAWNNVEDRLQLLRKH